MDQHIADFLDSVALNYEVIDEDLAVQLWSELADELIAEDYIEDEDDMPFGSERLESVS